MKRSHITAFVLSFSALLAGTGTSKMTFTTIRNPGNAGDLHFMDDGTPEYYGAVEYTYDISRYAITNAQWALFSLGHSPAFVGNNKPVQKVSWYDAARYCNWMTSGSEYEGAYLFNPDGTFADIDRQSAIEKVVSGHWNRLFVLPTEDEWHKAAYYNAETETYHQYATVTDTPPIDGEDSMYKQTRPYDGPWGVLLGTQELNGTYNMMGNVWEWTESAVGSYRVLRGGSYATEELLHLSAGYRNYIGVPHGGFDDIGFRVVRIIPEPASLLMLAAGGAALSCRKRSIR